MDVKCPFCGEPIDLDSFHDMKPYSYQEATKLFRQYGCGLIDIAWNGTTRPIKKCMNQVVDSEGAKQASHVFANTDDMDFAASMLDD